MTKIKIRKAKIQDWKTIQHIQKNDGFSHAYYINEDRIRRLLKRGEIFLLAFLENKPVGFASIDFEIRAVLHFISVLKISQGKGVGDSLLKTVKNETLKRKYNHVIIFSEKSSFMLNNFLKKNEFKKVGYHKDRYGNGRDGIIWSLNLNHH